MSISSQITRIQNNIAAAYTACSSKGATIPQQQNSANLADTISSIQTGGGSVIPIDADSQTPLYFGVSESGFRLSSNPADETPVFFGVNSNGHPYVTGGTTE